MLGLPAEGGEGGFVSFFRRDLGDNDKARTRERDAGCFDFDILGGESFPGPLRMAL